MKNLYEPDLRQPHKILICGDRNWTDESPIQKLLLVQLILSENKLAIITGGANGADKIAEKHSKMLNIPCQVFIADWNKYGRSAGPIRNRLMLDEKPEEVFAFHNDIKSSKGTKDCVVEACRRGIKVSIYANGKMFNYLDSKGEISEDPIYS